MLKIESGDGVRDPDIIRLKIQGFLIHVQRIIFFANGIVKSRSYYMWFYTISGLGNGFQVGFFGRTLLLYSCIKNAQDNRQV